MGAKVRDVMTPGPIGVDYHQSIGEAARTMRDWGIGAVLVVSNGSLYGLITERDLVIRVVAEARAAGEPVGPLSSGNLIGVDADADIGEAARLMREHAVRRLPVLEDGQVTGIVSLGDLAIPTARTPGSPRSPGRSRWPPDPGPPPSGACPAWSANRRQLLHRFIGLPEDPGSRPGAGVRSCAATSSSIVGASPPPSGAGASRSGRRCGPRPRAGRPGRARASDPAAGWRGAGGGPRA